MHAPHAARCCYRDLDDAAELRDTVLGIVLGAYGLLASECFAQIHARTPWPRNAAPAPRDAGADFHPAAVCAVCLAARATPSSNASHHRHHHTHTHTHRCDTHAHTHTRHHHRC